MNFPRHVAPVALLAGMQALLGCSAEPHGQTVGITVPSPPPTPPRPSGSAAPEPAPAPK